VWLFWAIRSKLLSWDGIFMALRNIRDVAKIVSNVLNPYAVLSVVVAIIAYQESPSLMTWAEWTAVTLSAAYVLPVIYIQARIRLLAHTTGESVDARAFFREQPGQMALLTCIFGIPSATILYFLGYPFSLIAILVGVAVTSLLTALVNKFYRASFHVALFTSVVVPLGIIFGLPALAVIPFIFLLGASRYYLGEHTPLQLTAGFFIGLLVAFGAFYGFSILT
jgi:hypothetical protein